MKKKPVCVCCAVKIKLCIFLILSHTGTYEFIISQILLLFKIDQKEIILSFLDGYSDVFRSLLYCHCAKTRHLPCHFLLKISHGQSLINTEPYVLIQMK